MNIRNFNYERIVNNQLLENKDKLEIERSFTEIAALFKDSNTTVKTDHIAESKYQELLNFTTQLFDESDAEYTNFVVNAMEENLGAVFKWLKGCKAGYSASKRMKLASAVNCCYDLLLRKITQEQSALDQQKEIAILSSSEIGILKILSKYTVLRYSKLESYLKTSEYYRSSTTFQRELKRLLDTGIIVKETLGKKPAYRLTSTGKLFLNSGKDSKLENVSSYRLSSLYLCNNFLSKLDFRSYEYPCSSHSLIKEIASNYSGWNYLLDS